MESNNIRTLIESATPVETIVKAVLEEIREHEGKTVAPETKHGNTEEVM